MYKQFWAWAGAAVFSIYAASAWAQHTPAARFYPYKPSGQLLERCQELQRQEQYDSALAQAVQVLPGDTAYVSACLEQSNCLMSLKRYPEAIAAARRGYKQGAGIDDVTLLTTIADLHDYMGHKDSALAYYQQALRMAPFSSRVHSETGVALGHKEMAKAEAAFRKAIVLRPNYGRAYFNLGILYAANNQQAEAALALSHSLMMNQGTQLAASAFLKLEALLTQQIKYNPDTLIKVKRAPELEAADQFLRSGAARSVDFKIKSAWDDLAVYRQLYALFQSLESTKISDPWIEAYLAPFYRQVMAQNLFDAFAASALVGVSADKRVEKFGKTGKALERKLGGLFTEIVLFANRDIQVDGQAYHVGEFAGNGAIKGLGQTKPDPKGGQIAIGDWTYVDNSGSVSARVTHDQAGKLQGVLKRYYPSGAPSAEIPQRGGQDEGLGKLYYPDGTLKAELPNTGDERDGETRYYYANGMPSATTTYRAGKRNGIGVDYAFTGERERTITMADNEADGPETAYHTSGRIKSIYQYAKGKAEGQALEYYPSGSLQRSRTYKADNQVSREESYHENGKPETITLRDDQGQAKDTAREFFADGALSETTVYAKPGEPQERTLYHRTNGKPFVVEKFAKGKAISYTYFYDDGRPMGATDLKATQVQLYGLLGQVRVKAGLKGGDFEGEHLDYDAYGALREQSTYQAGRATGRGTTYFPSGQPDEASFYARGEKQGGFTSYYATGKLFEQASYEAGRMVGLQERYFADGTTVASQEFYLNGKQEGNGFTFSVAGRPTTLSHYVNGDEQAVTYYDTAGQEAATIHYTAKETPVLVRAQGRKMLEGTVREGGFVGRQTFFHGNGKPSTIRQIYRGTNIAPELQYGPTGVLTLSEPYDSTSRRHGQQRTYDDLGQPRSRTAYRYGQEEGMDSVLYPAGQLLAGIEMSGGRRHGRASYYAPTGQLQYQLIYSQDLLIGFALPGPDGKAGPIQRTERGTFSIKATFPNGKPAAEVSYKLGRRDGLYKKYGNDGTLLIEAAYNLGLETGQHRSFYPSGQLYETENYNEGGTQVGNYQLYHPSGKPALETRYQLGRRHGLTTFFTETGTILAKGRYYNGYFYPGQ